MYLKKKRILYFFNIVNRPQNQAVYTYFMVQYSRGSSSDWVTNVLKDFDDLKIDSSFTSLKQISSSRFKKEINEKIRNYAFQSLMERKEKKSKLSKLSYEKLELQKYLFDEKTTVAEKITAFKWRTRMAEGFGENYRGEGTL